MLGLIVGAAFLICGYFVLRQSTPIGVALIVLGVLVLIGVLTQGLHSKRVLKRLEDDGELSGILADFQNAGEVPDDVRIGQKYIFRARYDEPIRIADITRTELVKKQSLFVGGNELEMYVQLNGWRYEKLCAFHGTMQGGENTYLEIAEHLKGINPDIEIKEV